MHLAHSLCIAILLLAVVAADAEPPSTDTGEFSARQLDSILQGYAFKAFVNKSRTGVVYDGSVPKNLTGVSVAALRLRSGSFRRRGFAGYREFRIPVGVVEQPYVERLVLVYHNLGNLSSLYYPLPGYAFLTPVLGLLAYDAEDLSAANLSELDIRASSDPISVKFSGVKPPANDGAPSPSLPMCACFGLDGSVGFDNVREDNTCLSSYQGHFAIVKALPVAPSPAPVPGGKGGGGGGGGGGEEGRNHKGGRKKRTAWILVACSVVGGLLLLLFLLGIIVFCVRRCFDRKKMQKMEAAAEWDVPLPMARVGQTKAPVALETRTRPMLENEFVP